MNQDALSRHKINKLKKWLIVKLGGFVENPNGIKSEILNFPRREYEVSTLASERIFLSPNDLESIGEENIIRSLQMKLAEDLFNNNINLFDSGMCEIEFRRSVYTGFIDRVCMKLNVVKPQYDNSHYDYVEAVAENQDFIKGRKAFLYE